MTEQEIRAMLLRLLNENPNIAKDYKKQAIENYAAKLEKNIEDNSSYDYNYYKSTTTTTTMFGHTKTVIKYKNKKNTFKDDSWDDDKSFKNLKQLGESLDKMSAKEVVIKDYLEFYNSVQEKLLCLKQVKQEKTIGQKNVQSINLQIDQVSYNLQHCENDPISIIQEIQENNRRETNQIYAQCAKTSVDELFKRIGVDNGKYQPEEIDEIVELHDPKIVNETAKYLIKHPTENMKILIDALENGIVNNKIWIKTNTEGKVSKRHLVMAAIELAVFTLGTPMGVIGALKNDPNLLPPIILMNTMIFSMGLRNIARYKADKAGQVDNAGREYMDRDTLTSDCIDDFLDAVNSREQQYSK